MSLEGELLKNGSAALQSCSADNPILGLLIICLLAGYIPFGGVIWTLWNKLCNKEIQDKKEDNERYKTQTEALLAGQKATIEVANEYKNLTSRLELLNQNIITLDCKRRGSG